MILERWGRRVSVLECVRSQQNQRRQGRRPQPTYGYDQSGPEQNCFSAEVPVVPEGGEALSYVDIPQENPLTLRLPPDM